MVVGNIGRYQEFAMEINERCAGGFGKGMAAGGAMGDRVDHGHVALHDAAKSLFVAGADVPRQE